MNWHDREIPNDEEGRPMFKGSMDFTNDKNDYLASIVWFYDEGPFYAFAVDPSETKVIRRIGPCMTLEGAKESCMRGIEGKIKDLSKRAGWPLEDGA